MEGGGKWLLCARQVLGILPLVTAGDQPALWFKEQPGNARRILQERHTCRAGRVLGALLLLLAVTCAGAARAPLGWVSVCKGWRMGGHEGLPLGVPLASSCRWLGGVNEASTAPIRKAPGKEGGGAQPGEGRSTCRASWGGGWGVQVAAERRVQREPSGQRAWVTQP